MLEKVTQTKIMKYLIGKGYYVTKVIVASKAGVPDILACHTVKYTADDLRIMANDLDRAGKEYLKLGIFIGVEVKAEKGKPSALQLHNLKMIEEAGGIGILAYNIKDVRDKLRPKL